MDQLKVFLKQCVKYRFWIACVVSLLLPIIGYFAGSGTIVGETTKREGEINGAKKDIVKYKTPGIVNNQYQPLASTKKEALIQDVDATWRKLHASQESLLKWPPEVQDRFRKWGRKYPTDVDRNQVQSTIIDYTVSYPEFVEKIYTIFKPFNFDDGSGIVVAPDSKALLAPAVFSQDSPPDLTKIWAEQERLWVVTALLDVVAKVNDSVGAKDWDSAIVKQINSLEVGSPTDQDQRSIAKGETLVPADVLADPAAPPAAAPAATPTGPTGAAPNLSGAGGGATSHEVFYLKTDSQQYKILPIKMTVLVDQTKLENYLVGLENSPMAIEVNEVEIAKPLNPVAKPAYGERSEFNSGMPGSGSRGENLGAAAGRRPPAGPGRMPGYPGGTSAMGGGGATGSRPGSALGGLGVGGPGSTAKKGGVDIRGTNQAEIRREKEKREKEAASKKGETKKIDQYYNVIEVTVYGRARFYLAPPPAPEPPPSTAATPAPNPAPDATKAEPAPAPAPAQPAPPAEAAKKDEAPKAEDAKPEPPKAEPAPAKDEAPKAEPPKPEAPKAEPPAPKR